MVNASGSFNFTYVYHNGDLVAQQNPDGSKLFVVGDNKGSTSVILNSSGSVLERTTFSPSGEVLSGGRLNRYGYEGKEQEMGNGKIPTDGLVSYYALEGGAFDDGVGNQGSVVNATLTSGQIRDAYAFNGNGAYVAVNDSNSLDFTGNFTLSAWIKPAKATQGYVVEKQGAYMLQFISGTNTTQGGIYIAGTWTALATSSAIPLNTWSHVVFTYNKSNAIIYINGVSSGTGSSTSNIDTNNNPLWIGAKNSTDRTRDFNGSIDEVGIWNRALTSTEVTQLYNYGSQFESGYRSTDFEARRYNPNFGIFEKPDTIISDVYSPQSLNSYMFEKGSPYKYKDPTGHIAGEEGFVVGSYGFGPEIGIPMTAFYIGFLIVGSLAIGTMTVNEASDATIRVYEGFDGTNYDKKEDWLDHDLPRDGDEPFIGPPPKERGNKKYKYDREGNPLDKKDRSWKWDKTEKHWDRQDLGGGHTRITPDGRLLSVVGVNGVTSGLKSGYDSGSGSYFDSGKEYPHAEPKWKPNPDIVPICVSGC